MSSDKATGKVFLAGAGPGDPALITLKLIRCLSSATVVCYDNHVNQDILQYAPENAQKIFVGKKGHEKPLSQDEINHLLLDMALAGEIVVRLKGGDSMLFSRGAEEALFLAQHGIDFEIIPGITSAIAAPTYAGIPVTYRDVSSAVHIFTGHLKDSSDGALSLDWKSIARLEGTLIFLMGYANLSTIVHLLIKHGKEEDTPIALIQWATLPQQITLVSTLRDVLNQVTKTKIKSPIVVVIGSCVHLRERLNWLESRPIFGKRILITRPLEQGENLALNIRNAGGYPLVAPVISISPLEDNMRLHEAFKAINRYNWLLFTSSNSVNIFMEELYRCGKDLRSLAHIKIGTIGSSTADELKKRWGLQADFVPSEFIQENLAGEIPIQPGETVLLPRATTARDVLPIALRQRGVIIDVVPLYEISPSREGIRKAKSYLREHTVDIALFTASSTVKFLLDNIKIDERKRLFKNIIIASIGPVTSKVIREYELDVHVEAREYTIESLLHAIILYLGMQEKR